MSNHIIDYFPEVIIPYISIKESNIKLKGHGRKVIQKYINQCYDFKINNLNKELKDLQGEELANFIREESKRNSYDTVFYCTLWSIDNYKRKSHKNTIKIKDLSNIISEIKRYDSVYGLSIWNDNDFIKQEED